ncbi:MAG: thioesterase family protein [Oscillospiraceae bacterium]
MIEKGLKGTAAVKADNSNTAKTMGSGSLDVFATPAMVALMEKSAVNAIADYLGDGETTVGTYLGIEHISATPVGMEITAVSEVTEVNGREIVFSVEASDNAGVIGKGTHKRFIVNSEKFMNKTNSKK